MVDPLNEDKRTEGKPILQIKLKLAKAENVKSKQYKNALSHSEHFDRAHYKNLDATYYKKMIHTVGTYLQLHYGNVRQCLPFSWTTLRGKHCRHPIAVIGVVDTFGPNILEFSI